MPFAKPIKLTSSTLLKRNHKHLFNLARFSEYPQLPYDIKS